MTYHMAICDDRTEDIQLLRDLVGLWAEARGVIVQTDCFESGEAFWFHYGQDKRYDLLLLDIEMEGMSGLELARRVRAQNDALQIVFVTGYSDYIAEGYDVSALHYLLKPLKEEKLFSVLDRARETILRSERVLSLESGSEMIRIPLSEIHYVEVLGNYVTLHGRMEYTVRTTLSAVEKQLDDSFFRVGRSFIVQLSCIRRVRRNQAELSDGALIPLPRGAYEALNRAIISMK